VAKRRDARRWIPLDMDALPERIERNRSILSYPCRALTSSIG
jgi:hypothetical protein